MFTTVELTIVRVVEVDVGEDFVKAKFEGKIFELTPEEEDEARLQVRLLEADYHGPDTRKEKNLEA